MSLQHVPCLLPRHAQAHGTQSWTRSLKLPPQGTWRVQADEKVTNLRVRKARFWIHLGFSKINGARSWPSFSEYLRCSLLDGHPELRVVVVEGVPLRHALTTAAGEILEHDFLQCHAAILWSTSQPLNDTLPVLCPPLVLHLWLKPCWQQNVLQKPRIDKVWQSQTCLCASSHTKKPVRDPQLQISVQRRHGKWRKLWRLRASPAQQIQ